MNTYCEWYSNKLREMKNSTFAEQMEKRYKTEREPNKIYITG